MPSQFGAAGRRFGPAAFDPVKILEGAICGGLRRRARQITRGPSKVSKAQLAWMVSEVDLQLIFIKRNRHVFGSMYGRAPR